MTPIMAPRSVNKAATVDDNAENNTPMSLSTRLIAAVRIGYVP